MGYFLLIAILLLFAFGISKAMATWICSAWRWANPRRFVNIFDRDYINNKVFYMQRFGKVPNTSLITAVDATKAFAYVRKNYGELIAEIYQACYFDWERKTNQFSNTLIVLHNKVMLEIAGQYVIIIYAKDRYHFAGKLITELSEFKVEEKTEEFEINIITFSANGLELKQLEIKPTFLDIGLYYNDNFMEVDELIRKRLNQRDDKGIVLLHGLPGTGKTTYLRHLIGALKKKVLFVSPAVAGNLMNPEFLDILIDNPNSVLIIEDAENIMMDRKFNSDSSVSNLLNLSDGLLSDCLSVQIICTFNSSVSLIDTALMREGRLIARYEFGKLEARKAQALSDHLGFKTRITCSMSLAEITSQDEKQFATKKTEIVGFRRMAELQD